MIKAAIFLFVVMIASAYFIDSSAFKPWGEAANQVGEIIAQAVKDTGESANKAIRDEARKSR